MDAVSTTDARRLALCRAGLLAPQWAGFPTAGAGAGVRARRAAHAIIDAFGYLQLDTVSIAGARSHVIVLMSRLPKMTPSLGEALLVPGAPLFEYWGHEASWLPMSMYPVFDFRRQQFRTHPWWGDVVASHPKVAKRLRRRIRDEGPLRSADMEGPGGKGWWDFKVAKRVATALWSSGELAIRERKNFQRTFDLADRVIPVGLRDEPMPQSQAIKTLLLHALAGHGWATTGTLAATWRLRNLGPSIKEALTELVDAGDVMAAALETPNGRKAGWIRPADLELAQRLRRVRPRADRGVLLSPFDPVLWDRARVRALFDFDQVLEIFKPAAKRTYGYYCLPVLAGDALVARVDLKADKKRGELRVLSRHFETRRPTPAAREATRSALERFAGALELTLR